jgi:hypothetical protein
MRLLPNLPQRPQLVVRTYVKGTSTEMIGLAAQGCRDVVFVPMEWDDRWFMPTEDDQRIYTSMLRECALGINAASTVSLELMIHRKPIINLGFDPPGSNLPKHLRYSRHTDEFDHYIPIMKSGAVMVARSEQDMHEMLRIGLEAGDMFAEVQAKFLMSMFGDRLDGCAGKRIADVLLGLSK